MADEEPWPEYDLRSVHHHVHAIGVLSSNFNDLENQLLGLLKVYDGAPDDVVAFLFEKLPTETRLDWLLRLVSTRKPDPPQLSECLYAFAKAYQACADNRNLIVHARIDAHSTTEDILMVSKRVRAHGEERHHDLSLALIRRVADEVRFWGAFGHHLLLFVLRRQRAARHEKYKRHGMKLYGPTTLPQISSPPVSLAKPSQSAHEKPPRRPRSSRASWKAERKKLWKRPKSDDA